MQVEREIPDKYIRNYGSERTDYIGFNDYLEIFKASYDIPSLLVKLLHFNDEFPENKNILYCKKTLALVKIDNQYLYKSMNILLEDLVKDKCTMMSKFARENKDAICEKIGSETYESTCKMLLQLSLENKPKNQYKRQTNLIADMILNTKKIKV